MHKARRFSLIEPGWLEVLLAKDSPAEAKLEQGEFAAFLGFSKMFL